MPLQPDFRLHYSVCHFSPQFFHAFYHVDHLQFDRQASSLNTTYVQSRVDEFQQFPRAGVNTPEQPRLLANDVAKVPVQQ